MKDEIIALEERIRRAQLSSNVNELDELIADHLQFIFFDKKPLRKISQIQ